MAASLVQFSIPVQATLSNGSTFSLPGNVTAGNALIIVCAWYGGCPPSITDSQGNTWTRHTPASGFYAITAVAGSSGANTMTVSAACSSNSSIFVVLEVSGLQTTPFDQFSSNLVNSTSPVNAGSITPTTSGQYIVALYDSNVVSTFTQDSPFVLEGTYVNASSQVIGAFTDYVQPTAGAITPAINNPSVSSSYKTMGWAYSFKASGVTNDTVNVNDTTTMSDSDSMQTIDLIFRNPQLPSGWSQGLKILG